MSQTASDLQLRLSADDLSAMFENIRRHGRQPFLDCLHTGIAVFSSEGRFIYANRAFRDMFNLPEDLVGKHITDYFLTGERGVMSAIRTKKTVICSSSTNTNASGVSFRYPVLDERGELRAVIVESIPTSIAPDKLLSLLDTVRHVEQEARYYEQSETKKHGTLNTFENLIGESAAMESMRTKGLRFAISREPILITGESGTGKELVAQALHMASPRVDKPFVSVNCAALPQDLMESELFGYAPGAFTGARSGGAKGKFEMADHGTIFLDEIGELPLFMQAKLLRVLESGEVQKIGHAGTPIYSDFRLITATNRNLAELVQHGQFREDLYHRLNIFELHIPPLRERKEDIYLLTSHFIQSCVGNTRAQEIRIAPEVYSLFMHHPWHGNVRELKNVLTYAVYAMGDNGPTVTVHHLPERFLSTTVRTASGRPADASAVPTTPPPCPAPASSASKPEDLFTNSALLKESGDNARRQAIQNALFQTKYNKTLTAQMLGISRNTLYRLMHEYHMLN